jgi:hypothetical protein
LLFALEKTLKLADLVLSKANQQNRIALNLTVLDRNTDNKENVEEKIKKMKKLYCTYFFVMKHKN